MKLEKKIVEKNCIPFDNLCDQKMQVQLFFFKCNFEMFLVFIQFIKKKRETSKIFETQ